MTRSGALRQALRQAGDLIEQGKTLLIFPEGTRGTDGGVHEFKPAVGYLALHHGIDVLPVYLGGTFAALPKGATMLRRRDVEARIGPPLEIAELKRLTQGMPPADAARAVARLIERAVIALSKGEVLDIKVRFHGWVENGLLKRVEEIHDARYIEAYERFVFHMMQAAGMQGGG